MSLGHRPHPLKALRDLCVYAPIGFLVEAPRLIPEMISVGRERMAAARGVGRMAVQIGQQRLAAHRPGQNEPAGAGSGDPVDEDGHDVIVEVILEQADPRDEDDGLAIPGYDQLAASQVVARLSGLGPTELDQVAAYEQAHRARRTVLSKITQLRRT